MRSTGTSLAAAASGGDLILWVAFPYACLAVFVVGHVWRYRQDQFGWTSRTSQLLEHRWLRWGSPLFHLGAFAVIGGHVLGLVVPVSWTEAAGISEHTYHLTAVSLGTVAGVAMITGLGMLCARRLLTRRVRLTTDRSDKLLFPLLSVTVLFGFSATAAHNLLGGGYDYRSTISIWFRGVFVFHPHPEAMAGAPLLFQLHALSACLLFAAWPFTRLVHVWSAPVGYLIRPYLVYRRRTGPAGPTGPRRCAAGPEANRRARDQTANGSRVHEGHRMKDWIDAVREELGIDLQVDVAELLDMTRIVAHGVARPAAPLTAFLVGYAAARTGGGPEAVAEANRRVSRLAGRWVAERPEEVGAA